MTSTLSFEREPDAGVAARIDGEVHQTIVARERASGRIAAIAARTIHRAFVNGEPMRIGYLGQLRIARTFRASCTLMSAGYAFCRALHDADPVPLYITSVLSGNVAARRLLVDLLYRDAPAMRPIGRLLTVVARPGRMPRASPATGLSIHRGSSELVPEIVDLLQRNGRRHQFARVWTSGDLTAPLGPGVEHLLVARAGTRIVGCLACWDQRAFKQVRVRGYAPALRRWRWLINACGGLTGTPSLPPVGRRLEMAYLSHVAIDDDRTDVLRALLSRVGDVVPADVEQVVAGFSQDSPLLEAFRGGVRSRLYESVLFAAAWPDGEHAIRSIDGRRPHLEIAVL